MRIRLFFNSFDYVKKGSSVARSSALSTTPLVRHNTSPFRKSISVGTDWMRYWLAVTPYLSTSTLMIRMRSPNTLFTCSRIGCIALQGWHHVAKKSTRTSWQLFITLLNVSIIICLFPWNDWKFCRPLLLSRRTYLPVLPNRLGLHREPDKPPCAPESRSRRQNVWTCICRP